MSARTSSRPLSPEKRRGAYDVLHFLKVTDNLFVILDSALLFHDERGKTSRNLFFKFFIKPCHNRQDNQDSHHADCYAEDRYQGYGGEKEASLSPLQVSPANKPFEFHFSLPFFYSSFSLRALKGAATKEM
jgi:hypothetical protein